MTPHWSFQTWKLVKTVNEFVEIFIDTMYVLTHHQLTAKAQSARLKNIKQNLTLIQCLALIDFSKNYTYILQDVVQVFHWKNVQETVYPFVVYVKNEEELKS